MAKTKIRTYRIDGDAVEVMFDFHEQCGAWIGNYPYFAEEPRITPSGRAWRNVTYTECPHASHPLGDCGTCSHLRREQPTDLIGVCFYDGVRQNE